LATLGFDSSLETAQRDAALQLMASRSTQPAHVHNQSLTEQNAFDRPVDVSFRSHVARMHIFTLGQQSSMCRSGGTQARGLP